MHTTISEQYKAKQLTKAHVFEHFLKNFLKHSHQHATGKHLNVGVESLHGRSFP